MISPIFVQKPLVHRNFLFDNFPLSEMRSQVDLCPLVGIWSENCIEEGRVSNAVHVVLTM